MDTLIALPAHTLLQLRGIARALYFNAGDGTLNLRKIIGTQHHGSGPQVLCQPVQLGGAGDRYDPGLLCEQPCQRNRHRFDKVIDDLLQLDRVAQRASGTSDRSKTRLGTRPLMSAP